MHLNDAFLNLFFWLRRPLSLARCILLSKHIKKKTNQCYRCHMSWWIHVKFTQNESTPATQAEWQLCLMCTLMLAFLKEKENQILKHLSSSTEQHVSRGWNSGQHRDDKVSAKAVHIPWTNQEMQKWDTQPVVCTNERMTVNFFSPGPPVWQSTTQKWHCSLWTGWNNLTKS